MKRGEKARLIMLDVATERIAASLREFGYPDVTARMVREIHAAYQRGETKMPHGVIGVIVKGKLDDAREGKS